MPKFRKGAEAIRNASARKSSTRFTPTIFWGKNDSPEKYLQFITPLSEIPEVLTHTAINIGVWEDSGRPRKTDFVSRKDPAFEEDGGGIDGLDLLWDEVGLQPSKKSYAVVLELEPIREGKHVVSVVPKTREYTKQDGETVTVPQIGILVQTPFNFFNYFTDWEEGGKNRDITKKVWRIKKSGVAPQVDYTHDPTDLDPVDLSDLTEHIPDLEAYITELASEDRQRELVGPLLGKKDTWKWTDHPRKTKGGKRAAVAVEEEEPPFEPDPPKGSPVSKFSDLKKAAKEREAANA